MRIQFSLRTLLAVVGVAACFFAWLGPEYRRTRLEGQAVSGIVRTGGEVYYDYAWPHADDPDSDGFLRLRLRRIFGDQSFGRVRGVYFGAATKPSDVKLLSNLPSVKLVAFVSGNITPEQISELSHAKRLRQLRLFNCNIDPATYQEIGRCSDIESLWIVPPTVTTAIPMGFLRDLTKLKELWIDWAVVDVAEIAQFTNTNNITSLRFYGSQFVGGIESLRQFAMLEELWLPQTNIGDADLVPLEELHKLRLLILIGGTSVGVERLKTALPHCLVVGISK